jgi:arylsulfatase A-like enzyme
MIQHQFKDKRTAFVVNAQSYLDVSGGFGKYSSKPQSPDAWVLENAKEVLIRDKPIFMRMHMQRPGIEGEKVSKERYADKSYYRNIWHPESPYRSACELADKHLGEFVAWLKEQNLWDETVLLLCGDHGQADEGWHEPYSESSSTTPLIIVGTGIPAGRAFEYCEIFDLAPTIAFLTGVEAPSHSIGRVLREALDATLAAPTPQKNVEQLNRILRASNALDAEKRASLTKAGFLSIDELGLWHTTEAGVDFVAFVSRQRKIYEHQQGHSRDPRP